MVNQKARKKSKETGNPSQENMALALSSILDNLPGHVYWKDVAGVYQGCNYAQAKSAGFSDKNEMIGKTDFDMPWKAEAKRLRAVDLAVMKSKKTLTREELSRLEGSDHVSTFLSKKTPLLDQNGNVIGILGVSLDITDRKKLEEDLKQAKHLAETAAHAKTEFITNMSHDLRTPLAGIITAAQILEKKAYIPEEKALAEMVHQSGDELLAFINGILEDSISDNVHEHEVIESECDLRNMVKVIKKLEMPAIKTKNIKEDGTSQLELHIELDPHAPHYIITDCKKLERILLNLIGNAIKFTEKGSITLRIQELSRARNISKLKFTVADTGAGIPKDIQAKVFNAFFKFGPSDNRDELHKSYGKGLSIVQKYVELLGGKIKLISHVGEGSTFYFTLSLKIGPTPAGLHPQAVHALKPIVSSSPNMPLCLLVEDNPIALYCLEQVIAEAKCQSHSAVDAESALILIKNNTFDFIITDLGLPGLSGIELTQQVRAWEKNQGRAPMRIFGLSAAVDEKSKEACLQAGMDDVFMKPINDQILKKIIAAL